MDEKSQTFKKLPSSYWIDSVKAPEYPELKENMSIDVAIIGGGISGITCGYMLKKQGLKVAVLEVDKILEGTTGHTTAKVTSQHGLIYANLIRDFGIDLARQYAMANEAAISRIEEIVNEHQIQCDFERLPAYIYTQDENYVQKIMDEIDAASALGLPAHFEEKNIGLPFEVKAAMKFNNQAQFHPRKYLIELAKNIEGDGSYIFEHSKVVEIKDGTPCKVFTESRYEISAKYVVVASHFPSWDLKGFYFARMYPERSYSLGVDIEGNFALATYISAEEPTRSFRIIRGEQKNLLMVGGESHKTSHGGDTNKHYENLVKYANDNFVVKEIPYRWSTQDLVTMDGVPFIGQMSTNTPNIFVATGYGKWGMTNGTVAGMIITDLIMRGESPWSEIYSPLRPNFSASIKEFLKENGDVAIQLINGKLEQGSTELNVNIGEAVVWEHEGQKLGVFRDEENNLHIVDTTCTHLGCELKWNSAERSWDCPCHGSRFAYTGIVLEGPALKSIKWKES